MSIPQNKPLPISRETQNPYSLLNKRPETAFVPSSWNYGSFHQSNPRYSKIDKPVKLQIKENRKPDLFPANANTTSNNINKFGKRILKNEDKIVTEDLLKAMNDNKNIRGTSRKLSQTRSSSNFKVYKPQKENINTDDNYTNENQNNSQYERNSSFSGTNNQGRKGSYNNNNNNMNRSRASSAKESQKEKKNDKKTFKFGMTYDEWNDNKSRHVKISKTLNLIKEERMKEIDVYDNQINQKYEETK